MKLTITAEEQALIHHCLRGDARAQEQLYRRYVQAMYNTVIRMVGEPFFAEDIVQEVFMRVFRKLNTFNGESTLGAWIKRIAINTTLNFMRQNGKIRWVEIQEEQLPLQEEAAEDTTAWDIRRIHEGIKQLPEGCRIVLTLFLLEGYQHQEIAEILSISESTSKTQYRRGKQLLQQLLKEQRA